MPPASPVERLEAEASRVNARCRRRRCRSSRSAVHLHGAIGYTQACDLSLFYKRTLRLRPGRQRHGAPAPLCRAGRRHGTRANDATVAWTGEFPRSADWQAMPEPEFRRMVRAFLQQRYPAHAALPAAPRALERNRATGTCTPVGAGLDRAGLAAGSTAAWACRPTKHARLDRGTRAARLSRARPTRAS